MGGVEPCYTKFATSSLLQEHVPEMRTRPRPLKYIRSLSYNVVVTLTSCSLLDEYSVFARSNSGRGSKRHIQSSLY